MRISDWISDVCSSDLAPGALRLPGLRWPGSSGVHVGRGRGRGFLPLARWRQRPAHARASFVENHLQARHHRVRAHHVLDDDVKALVALEFVVAMQDDLGSEGDLLPLRARSEEHTSELQSLMRTSYAV